MTVTLVMDQLYQLAVPTPFKVGPVNCYLAMNDPVTLIDTGTLYAKTRAELDRDLAQLGIARRDLQRIIVTHAHADHYGLAAELVGDSGAEVWTHRFNRPTLESYESDRRRSNEFYWQIMVESGVPEEERQRIAEGRHGGERYAGTVKVNRTIDEGDVIHVAGRDWRVYHTPGHAGGLICLFDPKARLLLSNDHLLRDISSNPVVEPSPEGGPRPHRLVEYIQHLQRMVELRPSIAWTGHGAPIDDVAQLVRQRLAFHARRADRILELIGLEEKSAYEIAQPLFGRLSGIDSLLALSETIGHLEWLQEQGRVRSAQREQIVWWQRV
jgi:glyoxylase-like metal-dependent hydrolase (beta-lactamase superfamily II)